MPFMLRAGTFRLIFQRVLDLLDLAVACDVYDGVFCAVLFPTRCLG